MTDQRYVGGTGLVLRALKFAAHKHKDQRRKDVGASPYINHPITVAEVLWTEGKVRDPATIAAALLHDTVEDTETTLEELRGHFGDSISDTVAELTDVKWLSKRSRKLLQIARAGQNSRRAKLVKLADKISNLRDVVAQPPAGWSLERRREYFDWAKKVVEQLRGTNARLERRFDAIYRMRP
jgi:GTP diphosphokinase / guanosine-3',5'-bis(diphosphate) 3'-diphosphatase